MKRKSLILALFVLFVFTLSVSPVIAEETQNSGKPFQELWDAIEQLRNDIVSIIQQAIDDRDLTLTIDWSEISNIPEDIADGDDVGSSGTAFTGAPYRWMVFSIYSLRGGFFANNDPSMFGGVSAQYWHQNTTASEMTSDKEVLRTLFTRKGYGGKNAVVIAEEYISSLQYNNKVAVALFRIRNTTTSQIDWPVSVYMTSYWGKPTSIALNGTDVWNAGYTSRTVADSPVVVTLSIPPNQTSTAIFAAGSGWFAQPHYDPKVYSTSLLLAFTNDCLELPEGLEFVDDLDTATGGWDQ